jgi:hypothetical protein
MVNARELPVSSVVRLGNGATAEVIDNPRDGMWILVRFLSSESDPSSVGQEDMVLAPDVVEVLETPEAG